MTTLPLGRVGWQCLGASLWPGGTSGSEARDRPFAAFHLYSMASAYALVVVGLRMRAGTPPLTAGDRETACVHCYWQHRAARA
ncbi:MAG: hypothetical protein QOI20_2316 [Acidimicrobiaceae bacterium]|jgi:hypothetical protein|nr:hypothetical protein [Acidimicrobiaceae bacterium]